METVPESVMESVVEPVVEPAPEPFVEPAPGPVVEPAPEPVVEPAPEPVVEPPPPIMIPKPARELNNLPEDVLSSIEKTLPKPTDSIITSIVGVFNNIGEYFQLRFGSRRLLTEQGVRQTGH